MCTALQFSQSKISRHVNLAMLWQQTSKRKEKANAFIYLKSFLDYISLTYSGFRTEDSSDELLANFLVIKCSSADAFVKYQGPENRRRYASLAAEPHLASIIMWRRSAARPRQKTNKKKIQGSISAHPGKHLRENELPLKMAACSLAFTAPDYSGCSDSVQQKLQLNSPGVLSNICHVLCIFLSVELN